MKNRGIRVDSNICGCTVRTKYCVPCAHMLYELKKECELEITEQNYVTEIQRDIGDKNFNNDYDDDDENDDDILMGGLSQQNDNESEQSKDESEQLKYNNEVKTLFQTKLQTSIPYEMIVTRQADIEEVLKSTKPYSRRYD